MLPSRLKEGNNFMSYFMSRRPSLIIAVYAMLIAGWAACAHWILPPIVAAAYQERSWSLLNHVFEGHRSHPIEYYLDRWSAFAGAVILAAVLHLVIVLYIASIDFRRKRDGLVVERAGSRASIVLIAVSAAFLTLTVLSGARRDYPHYVTDWVVVLGGGDPWWLLEGFPFNLYGPLFNVLALPAWINPLANKLLFAFTYLVYIVWLIMDIGARRGLAALSWPMVVLWLVNPVPWVDIAYFGHFDVLVGLTCVAAVHGRVRGKDVVSGVCLASGILLKFLPVMILPVLAFDQRRFRPHLFIGCAVIVAFGFIGSVLVWGTSTFRPIAPVATRISYASIYQFLRGPHSPLWLFWQSPNVDWLATPCMLAAGLGVFLWCMIQRVGPALSAVMAVLATLLFHQVGYIYYQMVLFCIISYWAIFEWKRLRIYRLLTTLLVVYFGWIAFLDLAEWWDLELTISYSDTYGLLTFLMGLALLGSLMQFSTVKLEDR
jgi:hypothetical protein